MMGGKDHESGKLSSTEHTVAGKKPREVGFPDETSLSETEKTGIRNQK